MGCMVYGAVWLYAHTALYGAVWCCMAVWRQEGGGTGRGTCMAPYNCMVNCMALLLYGAPMRHRHTPLPHAETELSDIHSHANARVCLEVCLGFFEVLPGSVYKLCQQCGEEMALQGLQLEMENVERRGKDTYESSAMM